MSAEQENPGENRSVNVAGEMRESNVFTGDNYGNISIGSQISEAEIWEIFDAHNSRAARQAQPHIVGLTQAIERPEVEQIEEILRAKKAVIAMGPPGNGKSGLAFQLLANALAHGQAAFWLDCRSFPAIRTAAELQQGLSLGSLSLPRAFLKVREWKNPELPFLFLLDQIDSVVGTEAENEYRELAIDCRSRTDIQVVVFSRRSEVQERQLLKRLRHEDFQEVICLDLPNALPYLHELGIFDVSPEVEEMARNLLNLSLMAAIKKENSTFNFRNLTNEVALWDARLATFAERNLPDGRQWVTELIHLAQQAVRHPSGTFSVDNPPVLPHRHFLSEGFIQPCHALSQNCAFDHENLRDFLYAKNAVQTEGNVDDVLVELGEFRAQNIVVWMDKIWAFYAAEDANREAILRRLFDV